MHAAVGDRPDLRAVTVLSRRMNRLGAELRPRGGRARLGQPLLDRQTLIPAGGDYAPAIYPGRGVSHTTGACMTSG
jgi:hypothetical protein